MEPHPQQGFSNFQKNISSQKYSFVKDSIFNLFPNEKVVDIQGAKGWGGDSQWRSSYLLGVRNSWFGTP